MSTRNAVLSWGLLAAVAFAGCDSAGSASSLGASPSPGTTTEAVASARPPGPLPATFAPTVEPLDMTRLTLGPDEAPPGMEHDETVRGRETLTLVIVSGRDAEFEALRGFIDGRATFFSGDAGALLTVALAFEGPVLADMAAHSYQTELVSQDGYGFTDTERNTVAFESLCGTGPHPSFEDLIENICIWHTGPITFLVGGPMSMDDIRAIAEELQGRVESVR